MSSLIKEKRLKLKDIAEMVGLSQSAVSGVLNNNRKIRVNKEKRDKILEIVSKYNYSPNDSARALSTGQTKMIGYILSSGATMGLANNFFSAILAEVQAVCQARGYHCCVSVSDMSDFDSFMVPDKLRNRTIDGLVVAGNVDDKVLEQVKQYRIPTFFFSQYNFYDGKEDSETIQLKSESYKDIANAFQYLLEMGHKRITVQGFNRYYSQFFDKFREEKGDSVSLEILSASISDNFVYGYQLAERWLSLPRTERYTALLANYQVCFGFMHKLHEESVPVPGEISLIAGADIAECKWSNPSMSVINTASYQNAKLGAELLLDLVEKACDSRMARRRMREFYRPGDLIIRKSSGPAPL